MLHAPCPHLVRRCTRCCRARCRRQSAGQQHRAASRSADWVRLRRRSKRRSSASRCRRDFPSRCMRSCPVHDTSRSGRRARWSLSARWATKSMRSRAGPDRAAKVETFAPSIDFVMPNGPCFAPDGALYIAEQNRILRFPNAEADVASKSLQAEIVVAARRTHSACRSEPRSFRARVPCRTGRKAVCRARSAAQRDAGKQSGGVSEARHRRHHSHES